MRPIISHETDSLPLIDDFYEKRDLYESDIDTIIARIGTPDKPWNLGGLFVEFLSFYGSRLHQNEVVQLYTSEEVKKDRSRWSRKLLQISDPFRTDNVVTFSKAYQAYFFNCFLKSYLYFAIPQTASGPMLDVTLYQKMSESPLKKKAKPDTPKAANSLQSKQQENARKEKMDLSDLLPNDIDVSFRVFLVDSLPIFSFIFSSFLGYNQFFTTTNQSLQLPLRFLDSLSTSRFISS
ncbi:unnamed protein product [Nippostrongylus brasiliensis]|uniref:PAP-associated domain-containing protein n=1 Tax=Nippostrongylus brasiliensis TaxID=27835 RepID=A0A0N4XNK7_NIPBR|nr:unnamed protein product [Nippostrongylus brasiliensis]